MKWDFSQREFIEVYLVAGVIDINADDIPISVIIEDDPF
jgi:hypothetical protein